MKFKKFNSSFINKEGQKFEIHESTPEVGAYFYVCVGLGQVADYLQRSVLDCMEFGEEEYGVPMDSWQEVTE